MRPFPREGGRTGGALRIFKLKSFTRFCRKSKVDGLSLSAAIRAIETGNEDANLGGGVYKQRVAREGEGKSGGFRTIVLFKSGTRSIFAYGFPKSQRDNITTAELAAFKRLAREYLEVDDEFIDRLLAEGKLTEIVDYANEEEDDENEDDEDD